MHMSLVRWDPFSDMDTLFNRLLPISYASLPRVSATNNGARMEWSPASDIIETDKEYLIRAEIPAVKKEDVQVTFHDGMITIKGERRQHSEDKSQKYHRTESLYGTFERRFSLPDNVDSATIRCENKDGILTVRIPKKEPEKTASPKQIAIQ
jgi:HSP20 family protein